MTEAEKMILKMIIEELMEPHVDGHHVYNWDHKKRIRVLLEDL